MGEDALARVMPQLTVDQSRKAVAEMLLGGGRTA
ncbi:hypothetical protein M271_18180 [Streptomyces rapamycinicus NRRL 5491]|nr:hypothetical protein M271_18180 [Streptomyces rapamycinicus NRRL 5491]